MAGDFLPTSPTTRIDLSPARIAKIEQALELRKAGATYESIAQALRTDVNAARRYVQYALSQTLREPAEDVRTMELLRLDTLLLAVWREATTPGGERQFEAFDRALKTLSERRKYILGLDVSRNDGRMAREEVLALLQDVAHAIRSTLIDALPAKQAREILAALKTKTEALEVSFRAVPDTVEDI